VLPIAGRLKRAAVCFAHRNIGILFAFAAARRQAM
jgi:hypothetical protein